MRLLPFFLAFLCIALAFSPAAWSKDITVESVKSASGNQYHFYNKNNLYVGWETKRPNKKDENIKFCIPAAFTSTTDTIVGIHAYKGKVFNSKSISKPIGGALLIVDGQFEIFPTNKGAKFTPEFIESLKIRKASLFQQYQVVENKSAASFKDKKKFQMRAICKFTDGREGVVESEKAMSFKTFNDDLVAMGVQDGIYTDMGAWDEGWYRQANSNKLVPIGNIRSKTDRQTNWVIFYER